MKVSQIDLEKISLDQIESLIFSCKDDGKTADVVLLLGTSPENCQERALKAAEIYRAGRAKYIVPSGGVEWDFNGERLSEAQYMRAVLLENGVPDPAIIMENSATTTKENMLFGAVEINRALRFEKVKSVCVVTSLNHLRRSLALAEWLLPRHLEISGCPAGTPEEKGDWKQCERAIKAAKSEISLMKGLIEHGCLPDIEF